ncbi:hypothetical protein [Rhodanobacter sp. FW106-PBR-LB-2-11]|uniref:hypothetical protein n=1 Tax=Rhodanobacter sp. FW106-PBR-LB-2-11 TaxID=1524463 RepID=UPI0034E3C6D9
MTDENLTDEAPETKRAYRQRETELLVALNGFSRAVANRADLTARRRAGLQPRYACEHGPCGTMQPLRRHPV